jgi:hypothetical protein
MKLRVWICGRNGLNGDPCVWSILGVFSTRERAAARCEGPRDFVGAMWLDEPLPDEVVAWPGAERPRLWS